MLAYAGLGVAMANGTDKIKATADDVTPYNNDQNGVARYLNDYFAIAE
ncbi:hydrolase HAD superfamily Cof family [Lactiplantibacillus plantarum]|nr:hydrolase HAD superfamily Cof family [Lactiplantibacillus plantarum]